ncbi:MAG: hypothetical protein FWD61_07590 [Phycisphaerales bacterium]|nr:hypothetical protein [Phycisphaerales bacterium]
MGHTLLGNLPRTRKWRDVVELVAAGANVSQVANATIRAAEAAFSFVQNDVGYNQAVWLMTQLGLAGNQDKPLDYLRSQGIDIPANTSLPGITVAITEALDNHVAANGGHSGLGQIAQRALVDAVIQNLEPKLQQQSMFNMQHDDTVNALAELRKPDKFGQLSRTFFARLTDDSMNYFLSRVLAGNLGEGQRFATMNQMGQFEQALTTHCREASAIVEQFSNEWFSKHRYEEQGNISRESAQGFASWGLKKMMDELRAGAKTDGQ